MVFPSFLVTALFPVVALAANDWTQPCHTGQCQWDLPSDYVSGTVRLAGSRSAISDLTPAGGWTILDCNATSGDAEIGLRLVCHDPSKCDHLHLNGAENTLVRLPDDCSSEPFAVVTRLWEHDDQSIPARARSLLERRGGATPQRSVQGISLSTDFASTDPGQHGNVSVFLLGSSVPAFNSQAQVVPNCSSKNGIFSSEACNTLSEAIDWWNPEDWILEALKPFAGGSQTGNLTLPDQTLHTNLFNDSFSCPQSGEVPAFDGSISVDLNSTVTGAFNYAVAVAGNLAALDSSAISLVVGFNTNIDGTLSLDADITGSLSTGDITLFSIGLPGLDFGSIFKIGPTFNVYAEADASIEANLELDVDLSYTISGGQLVYPQPSGSQGSGGTYSPGDSNIKLSASPNVTANAQVSAHLKPSIEFGLSLAGHNSGLYLELDAFAELDLSLAAAASGSVSTDGSNSTSTEAGGCVDILMGLSVSAGADADLLVLFDADDKVVLYDTSFDLYKKCFGNGYQPSKREYHAGNGRRVPLALFEQNLRKDHRRAQPQSQAAVGSVALAAASAPQKSSSKGFSCPGSSMKLGLSPIVSQKVNATSYQEHQA